MEQGNKGRGGRDEQERLSGPVEALAAPEPITAVFEGVADLVGSTVAEISEILSPEEGRRRELAGVLGRGKGRGVER
jgi:hypothetical protein